MQSLKSFNSLQDLSGLLTVGLLAVGGMTTATAQEQPAGQVMLPAQQRISSGATLEMVVPLFKSRVITLDDSAARVAVGNPDIADIVVVGPRDLYVLGKDIGTTNVLLWNRDNRLIGSISLEVTHELQGLKAKLHDLFPNDPIEVRSVQRSIVLTGRVSDAATANAAVRLAEGYLAQMQPAKQSKEFQQDSGSKREDKTVGNVVNLLQVEGSQQVMLEVKVAEINRTELKRMNAQFNAFAKGSHFSGGGVNGGATFPDAVFQPANARLPVFNPPSIAPWGPAIDEFAPNPMSIQNQGLFASYLSGNFIFNVALDAAKDKGLAKILAEPNLTTQSGQEAQFLSGGEFPIPVPQDNGNTTIDFKEFGVGLKFVPVVLSSGHINLKLNVSVSELVDSNSIGIRTSTSTSTFVVPSLSKRSASGTVELGDGQTMVLAGMLNDNLRQVVSKFPGLGSVPILGALFRSQNFLKGQTELVILVTPHLAKPIAPKDVRLPTDSFVEPSDTDFYLFGRTEGKAAPSTSTKP